MDVRKLGAVVLMIALLVGFLSTMPILIDATTSASAEATATGDAATASTIQILPLAASIAGIGVSLLIIVKALGR